MADRKLFQSIAMVAFHLVCAYLAFHLTVTQTTRFVENSDTSTIDFKSFNESPMDKYPALSICFEGSELSWYNEGPIFESFDVLSSKYGELLKGKEVLKYQYDYNTRLYNQIQVDIRNGSNKDFDRFPLGPSDVFTRLASATLNDETSNHYGQGGERQPTKGIPFDMSYTTPDTICFTRKSNDSLNTIRTNDWLLLNTSIFGNAMYDHIGVRVFLHHPGQLLRSFHDPVFKSNVMLDIKEEEQKIWDKLVRIKIEMITVLRKRQDANVPCNNQLDDLDDSNIMDIIMKKVGCIPIYWKMFFAKSSFKECNSPSEYQKIFKYIQNYRGLLWTYDPPCADMQVLTKIDDKGKNKWGEPCINIHYAKVYYQDIQNVESFGMESFVSGVGGFIGIFLGYSLLQVPTMLGSLFSCLAKLNIRGSKKTNTIVDFRKTI